MLQGHIGPALPGPFLVKSKFVHQREREYVWKGYAEGTIKLLSTIGAS